MLSRLATNANTVETILHGSVGLLTARSGGHLVSLQCYVSPYDIFEEGMGTQLNLIDSNGESTEEHNWSASASQVKGRKLIDISGYLQQSL